MNAVTLPPELERFANEVTANGRYRDLDEVVRTRLNLLRQAEAERDGFFTIDKATAELGTILAEEEHARA